MTSHRQAGTLTHRWLRGTAGIAAFAMAGSLFASTPPVPPWENPSGYIAVGPGSAMKCQTFRVVVTPDCTGSIWDRVFWTPSLRLERGWCNNKTITGPGVWSWGLNM